MQARADILLSRPLGLMAARAASPAPLAPPPMGLVRRASVFSIRGIGNAGNIVDLIICLLSLLGSIVIILPFLLSKSSRKLRHALIFGLATSDLIASIDVIISTSCLLAGVDLTRARAFCGFLGYILSTAVFTQHCWNLGIALVTYMILVHPLSNFTLTVEKRLIWLWPLFWGVPLLIHGVAWIWVKYEYTGGYCTMNTLGAFTAIFQFVPRAAVTLVVIVLYTHLFFFLRRTNLFKAVSNASGSRQQSGSNSTHQHNESFVDALAIGARSKPEGGSADGVADVDGHFFATAPYITASSNSSTTEPGSGSSSSKRSLRARFVSAAGHQRLSVARQDGEADAGPDIPMVIRRNFMTEEPTIELQDLNSSIAPDQSCVGDSLDNTERLQAVTTHDLDGLGTGMFGRDGADAASASMKGRRTVEANNWSVRQAGPRVSPGRMDLPSPIVLVDSAPSSPKSKASRDGIYRSRSLSDPPSSGLQGSFVLSTSNGSTDGLVGGFRLPMSQPSVNKRPLENGGDVTDASPGPTTSDARHVPGRPRGPVASPRTFPRSPSSNKGSLLSPVSKRPSTTESYQTRQLLPSNRIGDFNGRPGRVGASSHTYMVGGKTGQRMLVRRASFGDLSESSDSDEDLYSFRPMQPRKDVADFGMTSAPREHLKHLNAPKIWANVGEALALGGHPSEGPSSTRSGGGDLSDPANLSIAVPMPATEQDFEQALGDDWRWGMDVTSPRTLDHRGSQADGSNEKKASEQSGPGSRLLRKMCGGWSSEHRQHAGLGSVGQASSDTAASLSSDGQGVESLGSTLNRQASLLMLLYPAAYVLLFSVSIIRIIDDLASEYGTSPSQDVLHSVSRWFIFAQGLFDAIIFQFIEQQFRKRMKRRRKRAMGEAIDDPFWTKVGKDAVRLGKRCVSGKDKRTPEAEEAAFRRGMGGVAVEEAEPGRDQGL
ncbi:hypothetical protein ACQY0O_007391 [Thecaphora frezii]